MKVRQTRDSQGRFLTLLRCDSCQMISINGIACHETGCKEAWRDETRECAWCGSRFKPKERGQRTCDEGCADAYFD